jgi:hypothetical protein
MFSPDVLVIQKKMTVQMVCVFNLDKIVHAILGPQGITQFVNSFGASAVTLLRNTVDHLYDSSNKTKPIVVNTMVQISLPSGCRIAGMVCYPERGLGLPLFQQFKNCVKDSLEDHEEEWVKFVRADARGIIAAHFGASLQEVLSGDGK